MTQAINTICPWSGGEVSDTSLTTYEGYTVGFCNTGCRDKFEKASAAFDEAIRTHEKSISQSFDGYPVEPYRPRQYRSGGLLEVGTARFKTYLIDRAEAPLAEEDALAAMAAFFDQPNAPVVPDHALGHIMVHRGEGGDWLLVHWWTPGGIMAGHLLQSACGALTFHLVAGPVIACVWEQIVVEHERRAWVRHMMAAKPDPEGFLADQLTKGSY